MERWAAANRLDRGRLAGPSRRVVVRALHWSSDARRLLPASESSATMIAP